MFGLRQKLSLGFGGLLAMLLLVSTLAITVLVEYRTALDRFFYENWQSVEYGQHVIESLQQLDEIARSLPPAPSQAALTTAAESAATPLNTIDQNVTAEDRNITLPGEHDIAANLTLAWSGQSLAGQLQSPNNYRAAYNQLLSPTATNRQSTLAALDRLSNQVRTHAQEVVDLNLANLRPVHGRAKQMADRAVLFMIAGAVAGTALAVIFTLLVARSILRPLRTVIRSIHEIEQGNLDLVVQVKSRDEIRQLAEAFNSMAAKLREFRQSDRAKLIRTQQTTQLAVNSLPDAIAVTGPAGIIELSNNAAERLFNLSAGADITAVADRRLLEVYREVISSARPSQRRGYESAVEIYDPAGQLRFFLPHAVPIADNESRLIGVTLVLADVTNLRRLDEMKSGLLSVVSHELKTPLTSIRMAVHLLLEERVGSLTAKQIELLNAAREDSDRLDRIVANLLDMGRLESGQVQMDLRPHRPHQPIEDAVDPLRAAFHDKGITLQIDAPLDLPDVAVDPVRIGHVFANLLTNALKFTDPGGSVSVSATPADNNHVKFTVADTGFGIPAEYLPRVFDRFFRVPGQAATTGAGLGLAIARDIVQAHNGSIEVQSHPGQGTSFSFLLAQANPTESKPATRADRLPAEALT